MRTRTALLVQAACVAGGVVLLVAASAVPAGRAQPVVLALAFAAMYLVVRRTTRRHAVLHGTWGARGLPWALAALVAGAALAVVPVLVTDAALVAETADPSRALASFSAVTLALTCATVLWEELWFRSPVLDVVRGRRAQAAFAVANGVLFAAVHLFNPRFDAAAEGPELVAAGTLLTLAYFASASFHVPLALHLGNNLAAAALRASLPEDAAARADAPAASLVRAALLAGACVVVYVICEKATRRVPSGPSTTSA